MDAILVPINALATAAGMQKVCGDIDPLWLCSDAHFQSTTKL